MHTEPSLQANHCDLSSAHYVAHIAGSGIAPDVAQARGYRTSTGYSELKSLGICLSRSTDTQGLLLPIHTVEGTPGSAYLLKEERSVPLVVYRPDHPETDQDGKVRKYLYPANQRQRLDCPPRCQPLLTNAAVPLWITEGQKKGDALASHDACALALLGVWNWRILEDWAHVALQGRDVRVVFDSDVMQKKDVKSALFALKAFLTSQGARVSLVFLPSPDGRKVGVDDYLMAHSLTDLEQLFQAPRAPAPAPAATPEAPTQPQRFEGHTAKALQGKHFAPLNWVIPGILPPGATLFTGRSKDGKSLLAWNLCMAVATGGKALGTYPVPQGDVLYLCLEDGERRAQTRLMEQMAYMDMADAPDNLLIVTRDASTIGDGFEVKILTWLEEHPTAKLIVIDILEKVRPKRQRNGSVYADDYAALSPIQQIAQDRNVAILVIHHSNKTKPDDFRDTASGSTGLLAACDTFWSLARLAGAADAVLNIIGRDVDSPALALQFQDGFWTVIGTAEEAQQSRATRDVLDALTTAHKPLTPSQLASTLAMPVGTIRVRLKRMLDRGEVHTSGDGRYIPSTSPLSSPERERHGGEQEGVTPVTDVTPVTPVTGVTLVQSELALQGGVTPTPSLTPWNNGTCDGGPVGSTGITGVTGVTGVTGGEVVRLPLNGHSVTPCVVCGGVERWNDAGVQRCVKCWPSAKKGA